MHDADTGKQLLNARESLNPHAHKGFLAITGGLLFATHDLTRAAQLTIEVKGRLVPHGTDDLQVIFKVQAGRYGIVVAQLHDMQHDVLKLWRPLLAKRAAANEGKKCLTRGTGETWGCKVLHCLLARPARPLRNLSRGAINHDKGRRCIREYGGIVQIYYSAP